MNAKKHMQRVADTGCVICKEYEGIHTPAQVHHIAEGSGQRSDWMVAGLCPIHHTGTIGIHGLGVKRFCDLFKLANEYALLGLVNKYME